MLRARFPHETNVAIVARFIGDSGMKAVPARVEASDTPATRSVDRHLRRDVQPEAQRSGIGAQARAFGLQQRFLASPKIEEGGARSRRRRLRKLVEFFRGESETSDLGQSQRPLGLDIHADLDASGDADQGMIARVGQVESDRWIVEQPGLARRVLDEADVRGRRGQGVAEHDTQAAMGANEPVPILGPDEPLCARALSRVEQIRARGDLPEIDEEHAEVGNRDTSREQIEEIQ